MNDTEELARLRAQVGRTAHDLANVLGIALNYTLFLEEDLPPEPDHPARQSLPQLESAARRAVELVRQLQDELATPSGGGREEPMARS
ncbi:hypothetical protein [Pilimelia columellifera]|uniref:hypothetical protein n=1 Tax=Pilimelia columellifera TaxID=706574 RepID=UPI0031E1BA0A